MIAKWLYNGKKGRALIGTVLNIVPAMDGKNGKLVEVRVTSNESKRDNGKVGSCFLVSRMNCIIEESA